MSGQIYLTDLLHVIQNCSDKLNFYLFADDTIIFYADKNLRVLEQTVNTKLHRLYNWLTSNKSTLKIKKKQLCHISPLSKETYI